MHFTADNSHQTASGGLDHLIAFDANDRVLGPADRLQRALSCRIASALLRDLRCECEDDRQIIFILTTARHEGIATFADLLHHPAPPLELLIAAKDYAKLSFGQPTTPLLPEVAVLIYYGAIAAALVKRRTRITTLTDDELRTGLNDAIRQPWLDDRTKGLFIEALSILRTGRIWRS